jgi:hypothetical protein
MNIFHGGERRWLWEIDEFYVGKWEWIGDDDCIVTCDTGFGYNDISPVRFAECRRTLYDRQNLPWKLRKERNL